MLIKNKYIKIISLIIFASVSSFGQSSVYSLGPWNINSLTGSVLVEGSYRQQNDKLESDFSELMKSSVIRSLVKLNANIFIWHPNFMTLDADLEYSPNAHIDNFLVIPNRTESNTAERIHLNTSIFNSFPVTLTFFGGIGHSYTSRDFATDVELKSDEIGGKISIKNSLLPFAATIQRSKWTETELQSARRFYFDNKNMSITTTRSFGSVSDNQLNFSYDDITSDYSATGSLNTKIAHTTLSNRISFEPEGKTEFNSFFSYLNSIGAQQSNRIDENVTFKLKLPENFQVTSTYMFAKTNQDNLNITQHNPIVKIENQLYLSLHSYAYFQYSNMNLDNYDEIRNIGGLGFNYQKLITPGILYVNYEFIGLNEKRTGTSGPIFVRNEEYSLEDGKVVLLKNPFVRRSTIFVKNNSGTIIYVENIDYVLIKRGDFIEIQRLPGGQIANRGNVYIDYDAESQSSYKFTSLSHVFETRVSLFERFLEVYIKILENNFTDVNAPDTKILKTSHQKAFGIEIREGELSGGIEADFYNSNIVPYNSYRIYLSYNGELVHDVILSLLGNFQYYDLTQDKELQRFADLSGKIDYNISDWAKAGFEASYRYQEGRGLGMNLLNLKTEYTVNILKLYLTFGLETFYRKFIGSTSDFKSAYLRIERRF